MLKINMVGATNSYARRRRFIQLQIRIIFIPMISLYLDIRQLLWRHTFFAHMYMHCTKHDSYFPTRSFGLGSIRLFKERYDRIWNFLLFYAILFSKQI